MAEHALSAHDYFIVLSVVVPIVFFGFLFDRGKLKGHGFEISSISALGLAVWSMLSAHQYFGVVHYLFH